MYWWEMYHVAQACEQQGYEEGGGVGVCWEGGVGWGGAVSSPVGYAGSESSCTASHVL